MFHNILLEEPQFIPFMAVSIWALITSIILTLFFLNIISQRTILVFNNFTCSLEVELIILISYFDTEKFKVLYVVCSHKTVCVDSVNLTK